MRFLLLVTNYPDNNGGRSLAYIHTRNILYAEKGINVDVINFASEKAYNIDSINVYPLSWFNRNKADDYDLLILHAPNLRNHYLFLRKYGDLFGKKIFFFHGHEVLKINSVYSQPYSYIKTNETKRVAQNIYDEIKFAVWRNYFNNNISSCHFIFVSNWMKEEFLKWIKINPSLIETRSSITYNCIGKVFESNHYDKDKPKPYDFITIRAMLDGSKYSVDIVNELAFRNPDMKFLLYGKGDFFNHYKKAPNLDWIDTRLNHQEMIEALNSAKCALMPTRTDAQGVMMCEMASFGMPLITSDISVCHEVFEGFNNVKFIDNNNPNSIDLSKLLTELEKSPISINKRYYNSVVGVEEYQQLVQIAST